MLSSVIYPHHVLNFAIFVTSMYFSSVQVKVESPQSHDVVVRVKACVLHNSKNDTEVL